MTLRKKSSRNIRRIQIRLGAVCLPEDLQMSEQPAEGTMPAIPISTTDQEFAEGSIMAVIMEEEGVIMEEATMEEEVIMGEEATMEEDQLEVGVEVVEEETEVVEEAVEMEEAEEMEEMEEAVVGAMVEVAEEEDVEEAVVGEDAEASDSIIFPNLF
jgi:hypothetical protein